MQRYASTMSMEWRDYEDFMKKYGYNHPEKFSKWTSRFFLYETMGILLKSEVVKAEKLYALGGRFYTGMGEVQGHYSESERRCMGA